jgi:hypothetical protein
MQKLLIAICICLFSVLSNAQKITLSGCIKDSSKSQPIGYASITNLSSKQTILSNKLGCFVIEGKDNDLIAISAIGYYTDTIRMHSNKPLMDNNFVLKLVDDNAVTVYTKAKYTKYQRDSILRRDDFMKGLGNNPKPMLATSNTGAGLGISLDRFSKREKDKRKAIDIFENMEKEHFINYHFSPSVVGEFAALSPDSLLQFVQKIRPTYKWLRKHNTKEDILYYVNDKLKELRKP